jgi:hypothetical protein
MKKIPVLLLFLSAGMLLGGCTTLPADDPNRPQGATDPLSGLVGIFAEGEMNYQNERDLERHRITPSEYVRNRDEIERTFR